MTKKTQPKSGSEIFVPLNMLKKSPRNVRKTEHSAVEIEGLAASIAANGMLQNLVVEPERDGEGRETGHYFVTIGEGRRLAQLLRAKRRQIKKTDVIRCVLDTEHDAHEISLAENVIRSAMHPADEFEAFALLHNGKGMAADDIAARFGVTPAVVRQRRQGLMKARRGARAATGRRSLPRRCPPTCKTCGTPCWGSRRSS